MRIQNIPDELAKELSLRQLDSHSYDISALWYTDGIIQLIDQRSLPDKFQIYSAKDYHDVAYVIKNMVIRGAPAIGGMAAYGMAQAAVQKQNINDVAALLKTTRPTAYDLFYAVDYMVESIANRMDPNEAAVKYVSEIIDRCKRIGEFGNDLIKDGNKLLTHCNAGALATIDHGTALAPMRAAHKNGKNIFVYVDETRPRLQGAKLTTWELYNEGIAHALIVDNAAGFYLAKNEIDLVLTGADRIANNGDAANKIGTYEKAVLAFENNVPFYIAAPISTFDLGLASGDEIPIEERAEDEVLIVNEKTITGSEIRAKNPAFDVTPHRFITGFVTEFGIIKPSEIQRLAKEEKFIPL